MDTLQTYKLYLFDTPIEYLNQNPLIRAYLVFFLIILGFVFTVYCLLNWLQTLSDKRKKVYSLGLRFPIPSDSNEEGRAISELQNFLNSSHELIKYERMSLEIHKVSEYLDLVLSTTNQQDLENIKRFLTNISRLSINELTQDYLDCYNKIYINRLVLSKKFDPLNLSQTQAFAQVCDYLSSLKSENAEFGSLLLILRPVQEKSQQINKLIKANNYVKISKPALTLEMDKQNLGLLEKSKSKMFFGNIYAVGSKNEIAKALSSNIKSLDGQNYFSTKKALFPKFVLNKTLKLRYITHQNLFVRFFRSFYGSYLNAQELALMFHPSIVQRGSYGTNKSLVIEASPEFFKDKSSSTLVGSSFLKTGEKRNVFLPNSSRRRHTYALGSTGSGKSTTLINIAFSVIKEKESSLIFFDPNGMDIKNIMQRLSPEELKERVVYLDPTNSENTLTINLFMRGFGANRTEKDALTENILNIFEQGAKDGDLGTSIKKLLKVLITTGVYFPDYYYSNLLETGLSEEEAKTKVFQKQLTLADIPFLLNKNYGFRQLLAHIFRNGEDNIALIWQNQIDSYNTNPSILDGIDNRLANITTDSILPMLEGSKLNITELVKQKKVVLIPNTEPLFGVKGKRLLPQMIMTELWAEVQREQNPDNLEKAVIIIDEVEEVQLPIIPTMLSQARKYGLSLVLANQYLFQLQDWFTKAILGNVANLFIFKMRNKDEVKYITPMFGEYLKNSDIIGLEKYQGYLTTLNDENSKSSNIMSFETINYTTNYPVLSDTKDLNQLANKNLEKYGEERKSLELVRKQKLEDPERWFLG